MTPMTVKVSTVLIMDRVTPPFLAHVVLEMAHQPIIHVIVGTIHVKIV